MDRTTTSPTVSVILPTLNEAQGIGLMHQALVDTFHGEHLNYEIIVVDDFSPDGTIAVVRNLRERDANLKYIMMSRRYGDQACLMAGIGYASGDVAIVMDSDLQHPPRYIPEMVKAWRDGADIVLMIRKQAGHTSFFKKWSEILFYWVMGKLSTTPIYFRFSGFALIDRKAVNALRSFKESEPFLRGLIGLVGFRTTELGYEEDPRRVGHTKYSFTRLTQLAVAALTSFSVVPLHAALYLGTITVSLALAYAIYILHSYFFTASPMPPGWASTTLAVVFMGGAQLITIGILGVYVGRIFLESKRRPNYTIADVGGLDDVDPIA